MPAFPKPETDYKVLVSKELKNLEEDLKKIIKKLEEDLKESRKGFEHERE